MPDVTGNYPRTAESKGHSAAVFLTHPDRVLFPEEGITKRDLADYYTAVAPYSLPHIVGRPLSIVRCPDGISDPCFYQKHMNQKMPQAVRAITIQEKAESATYIWIDGLEG
jgi:bifunctional non-homologous end joining protein LigD